MAVTVALYGIPNCDAVKRARARLAADGVDYAFHDYKKVGVDGDALDRWLAAVGWEALLNRAGTTFRKLSEQDRAEPDAAKARALMIAHPSLIRRPVVEHDGGLLVGFKPGEWDAAGL